ncbi:MAG: VWA domain-containing protein [Bacteroidetes bacterium]|nr:VWA domain-containing protein [Bacteroidota bacterium]
MKNLLYPVLCLLMLAGCSKDESSVDSSAAEIKLPKGINCPDCKYGEITAAEWNDLDNWDFWRGVLNTKEFSDYPSSWNVFTNSRISVVLMSDTNPVVDAIVELKENNSVIWASRSDIFGRAELWFNPFNAGNPPTSLKNYDLYVNHLKTDASLNWFSLFSDTIQVPDEHTDINRIDLAFIVDATGSMGDEIDFLKKNLTGIITKANVYKLADELRTASVFYRDYDDEYVTRFSYFSTDINQTQQFISAQKADGGHDYPEAVEAALKVATESLSWSENAKARLAFLILDAPPHNTPDVINSIQSSITLAAQKGIKIIPVIASGADHETEFLMRNFAVFTNGTFVFITDDSGIGNDHVEPLVGEVTVGMLKDILVRIIVKYSENKS